MGRQLARALDGTLYCHEHAIRAAFQDHGGQASEVPPNELRDAPRGMPGDAHEQRNYSDNSADQARDLKQGRPFARFAAALAQAWTSYDGHICCCATGIVVRAIAPLLKSKYRDPAVVVLDQEGRFVISLLSGHLGGANALAHRVAALTGGQAVITTASDTAGLPALDLELAERGLVPETPRQLTPAMAAMLRGEQLGVVDPLGMFDVEAACMKRLGASEAAHWQGPLLWMHWRRWEPSGQDVVVAHPRVLCVGLGCRRGVPEAQFLSFVEEVFRAHGLATASVAALGSLDAKAEEPCMLALARRWQRPITFFSRDDLAHMPAPTPSALVHKHMGIPSVAEAAALRLTGEGGSILVPKHKGPGMTCAVAIRTSSPLTI